MIYISEGQKKFNNAYYSVGRFKYTMNKMGVDIVKYFTWMSMAATIEAMYRKTRYRNIEIIVARVCLLELLEKITKRHYLTEYHRK